MNPLDMTVILPSSLAKGKARARSSSRTSKPATPEPQAKSIRVVETEAPPGEMDSMELYESRDIELDFGTIAEIDEPEENSHEERTLYNLQLS